MAYAAKVKEAVTIQCEEKRCNICGKHTNLTKDHVPPKFWHNKQMKRYSVSFGVGNPDMAHREFPYKASNGIVFNTLCAECNNTVLGTRGDQDLQQFVAQYEKKCMNLLAGKLPFSINVKANRVARSVVGHMLAAKRFYDEECNVDKVMRKYVLDTSLTPPTDYSLLYYPYPSILCNQHINLNDVFI